MTANAGPGAGRQRRALVLALLAAAGLGACGPAPVPSGIDDPREAQNREIHAFNKAMDRAIVKPLSGSGEGAAPLRQGVANLAANLDGPGDVLNGLMQGRPHHAAQNGLRFAFNTVFGLGGLFDPATAIGLPARPTDFGETLHVWGLPEGGYAEAPFIGPSTNRDLLGKMVDAAVNPWGNILPRREANAVTGLRVAGKLAARGEYADTVDEVLYDSADSYAQSRLIYLQNRRHQLQQNAGAPSDAGFIDPYEDPYGN